MVGLVTAWEATSLPDAHACSAEISRARGGVMSCGNEFGDLGYQTSEDDWG